MDFLPDLEALDEATLARTVAMFIASPANPQGAVASRDYFTREANSPTAWLHDPSDECYSEIYTKQAPGSALECAGPISPMVVVFQSLSKRSNCRECLSALRRRQEISRCLSRLRNSPPRKCRCRCSRSRSAAYSGRSACRGKSTALSHQVRSRRSDPRNRYGMSGPPAASASGSMCRIAGGDEAATVKLYSDAGVRVIPEAICRAAARRQQSRRRLSPACAGIGQ